jgi:CRP-like cAMP-binding protein
MKIEPASGGNQLLARLSDKDYAKLSQHLRKHTWKRKHPVYESGGPVDYAYFPTSCVISAVVVMRNGDMIEVATVGQEGATGLPVMGQAPQISANRVFVQVPGEGFRMSASVLAEEAGRSDGLRDAINAYKLAFDFQVSQSVACNGLHNVLTRCCRWLLMTHDRVQGDQFELTHELLAVMLAVRRSGVTEVLMELKQRNLIKYTRGSITVLDRDGLEELSCECYELIRDTYQELRVLSKSSNGDSVRSLSTKRG